jgi:hypothetical protein
MIRTTHTVQVYMADLLFFYVTMYSVEELIRYKSTLTNCNVEVLHWPTIYRIVSDKKNRFCTGRERKRICTVEY